MHTGLDLDFIINVLIVAKPYNNSDAGELEINGGNCRDFVYLIDGSTGYLCNRMFAWNNITRNANEIASGVNIYKNKHLSS